MTTHSKILILVISSALLYGCDQDKPLNQSTATATPANSVDIPLEATSHSSAPNVVEIRAVGLTLEGPSEIPSGWTTFRFNNASDMIHLVMIDVPPDGVDAKRMKTELVLPFKNYMDALNRDDQEAADLVLGTFPAWYSDLFFMGGPGFLAAHKVSEATVFLEPGFYVLECYVKTNGAWHTYNPDPEVLGMVMELRVTEAETGAGAGADAPSANLAMEISNDGFKLVSGYMKPGSNTVKVNFLEQQVHENFLGNDVHIVRIAEEDDFQKVIVWLDWRNPKGLETPAPALFYGGLNDMPAGATGYFSADLDPGNYAFIAEVPNADQKGFVLNFTVDSHAQ